MSIIFSGIFFVDLGNRLKRGGLCPVQDKGRADAGEAQVMLRGSTA